MKRIHNPVLSYISFTEKNKKKMDKFSILGSDPDPLFPELGGSADPDPHQNEVDPKH